MKIIIKSKAEPPVVEVDGEDIPFNDFHANRWERPVKASPPPAPLAVLPLPPPRQKWWKKTLNFFSRIF
jgi:hypothetical protein